MKMLKVITWLAGPIVQVKRERAILRESANLLQRFEMGQGIYK
ncbi:hypothetical protein B0I08_101334 [Glaciihabitans tibetensis]|uniref:Uncharacterized protein n=1 Tax=Glaciihabitans tibetensis TaxID=1266600 RepID=A0A2T0VJ03_9MICO|nr:hypothetical protein B0I08_101334 [Glaciihabitans tibetensis]